MSQRAVPGEGARAQSECARVLGKVAAQASSHTHHHSEVLRENDTTHRRSADTGLTKPDWNTRKWDKVMDERIPRMQGRQFLDHADFLG